MCPLPPLKEGWDSSDDASHLWGDSATFLSPPGPPGVPCLVYLSAVPVPIPVLGAGLMSPCASASSEQLLAAAAPAPSPWGPSLVQTLSRVLPCGLLRCVPAVSCSRGTRAQFRTTHTMPGSALACGPDSRVCCGGAQLPPRQPWLSWLCGTCVWQH